MIPRRNPRLVVHFLLVQLLLLYYHFHGCLLAGQYLSVAFVIPYSRNLVTRPLQPESFFGYQTSFSTPFFAKSAKKNINQRWYPNVSVEIEEDCLSLTADLIVNQLLTLSSSSSSLSSSSSSSSSSSLSESTTTPAYQLAISGKFFDLAQREIGIRRLELLFADERTRFWSEEIVIGSIYLLQSLCIMGMLVGVKGSPEQHERRVQHLKNPDWAAMRIPTNIRHRSIAELKFRCDQVPGTHLLAKLGRKRTSQGAMDLLIDLDVWTPHEDLGLLRSGFPIHFTPWQLQITNETLHNNTHEMEDIDDQWNIRYDLRHLKVYTIDSESTTEVDDGISLQLLDSGRYRYWIHIADADRWAPRDSEIFRIAQARTITHYLPTGPIPMFPPM
jgi:hypothetical protein